MLLSWNTRLCVTLCVCSLSLSLCHSPSFCRSFSLCLSVRLSACLWLISNKTPHFGCHSVSQMSLTSALRTIFGKPQDQLKLHPIPNQKVNAFDPTSQMEQALQLKRVNKAPCKNDRKAYLQRVMLTRWETSRHPLIDCVDNLSEQVYFPPCQKKKKNNNW